MKAVFAGVMLCLWVSESFGSDVNSLSNVAECGSSTDTLSSGDFPDEQVPSTMNVENNLSAATMPEAMRSFIEGKNSGGVGDKIFKSDGELRARSSNHEVIASTYEELLAVDIGGGESVIRHAFAKGSEYFVQRCGKQFQLSQVDKGSAEYMLVRGRQIELVARNEEERQQAIKLYKKALALSMDPWVKFNAAWYLKGLGQKNALEVANLQQALAKL